MEVGNFISGFSALSKSSLNIWKFMVYVLLKSGLENFEDYFTCVWDECNCVLVWAFFGIAFLWDWNENWPFPVPWPLLSFQNLLAYWLQHFFVCVFFFPFIFISWRLITLQYCSGFCHTLTWISHGFTCIPHPNAPSPPSPPDPSGSSQCTRSKHLSHASNLGWWSVSP